MTKPEIIEEINNNLNGIESACEQTLMSSHRNGIDEMKEVGEYAFFDSEYSEDYEYFIQDMKNQIIYECGYEGEIEFCTWSSKSGTSVFMDAFGYDGGETIWDFENEWGFTHNDTEVEEFTHAELMAMYWDVKRLNKEICSEREEYDKHVIGVTKIVDSMSEGKRSGIFSNGEVIFEPTNPELESFTAYYNPNEVA